MSNFTPIFSPNSTSVLSSVFLRQKDIFISNKVICFTSIFLFIVSLLIVSFLLEGNLNLEIAKSIEMLFILYSINLSSDLIIVQDYKKGIFEQFILSGVTLEYFLLAKILALLLAYTLLYVPILILYELIFRFAIMNSFFYYIFIKLLIIFNISINVTLSSSFLLTNEKRVSQILISMLINIPVFIVGSICYKAKGMFCLMLLLGIFLINLSLSIILSSYLIKISTEEN